MMTGVKRHPYAVILTMPGILVAITVGTARGSEDVRQDVRFLLAGLKESRQQLQRGIYRIDGAQHFRDPENEMYEGSLEIFCAFDYPKKRLRFDRRCDDFVLSEESAEFETRSTLYKHARTENRTVNWASDNKHRVSVHPSDEGSAAKPFDVRILGLVAYGELYKRSFTEVHQRLMETPAVECVKEQEHIYRVEWVHEGTQANRTFRVKRVVWIDEEKGYCPIRFEIRAGRDQNGVQAWHEPFETSEVTWTQVAGTWVPSTFTFHMGGRDEHFSFNWESVNEPVPSELFGPDGFGLTEAASIVDERSDKPVFLGVVAEPSIGPKAVSEGKSGGWTGFRVAVLVNVVLLAVLAAAMAYRRIQSARG